MNATSTQTDGSPQKKSKTKRIWLNCFMEPGHDGTFQAVVRDVWGPVFKSKQGTWSQAESEARDWAGVEFAGLVRLVFLPSNMALHATAPVGAGGAL